MHRAPCYLTISRIHHARESEYITVLRTIHARATCTSARQALQEGRHAAHRAQCYQLQEHHNARAYGAQSTGGQRGRAPRPGATCWHQRVLSGERTTTVHRATCISARQGREPTTRRALPCTEHEHSAHQVGATVLTHAARTVYNERERVSNERTNQRTAGSGEHRRPGGKVKRRRTDEQGAGPPTPQVQESQRT